MSGGFSRVGGTEEDPPDLLFDRVPGEGVWAPVEIGRGKGTRSGGKARRSILLFWVSPNTSPGRWLELLSSSPVLL